jgi:coenzyme F420-0:L-glutamate ligase/coenzyme F420-1:gamma-L-glutamate ligase
VWSFRLLTPFMPPSSIQIFPLPGLPEVSNGDSIATLIADAAVNSGFVPAQNDVFVVAQKIVSKAEGKFVRLADVEPSKKAVEWAAQYGKDPRLIEVVLAQAKRIVRMERGVIVAETAHGFICANAGVDASNVPEEMALLLPEDPDRSAQWIRDQLGAAFGISLGVIISDTFGRPWREGLVNVALGVAGVAPLIDYRGQRDTSGKLLAATLIAHADEIASAAELVMGKTNRTPVAIVRGLASPSDPSGSGRNLLRSPETDLFR